MICANRVTGLVLGASLIFVDAAHAQMSQPLRVEPAHINLGHVAPDEVMPFSVTVFNDTNRPIKVLQAKANCGCTASVNFQPVNVKPHTTTQIQYALKGPQEMGPRGVRGFLVLDTGQALVFEIDAEIVDARIVHVERYISAINDGKELTARRYVAQHARKWFKTREGNGQPFFTRGKWADWDAFFHSTNQIRDITLEGDIVTVTSIENNDFYQLIDRTPVPATTTYWFDAQKRIVGKIYLGQTAEPKDRLDDAIAWLRQRDASKLKKLMPDGEIDPTIENAKKWKALLINWRQDAGLPRVNLGSN